MNKIKKFIKNNKEGIIYTALIVGALTGLIIIGVKIKKDLVKIEKFCDVQNFNFGFNTIEEALAKFNDLSKDAPNGTIALWNKGMEGFEYLVQDLS